MKPSTIFFASISLFISFVSFNNHIDLSVDIHTLKLDTIQVSNSQKTALYSIIKDGKIQPRKLKIEINYPSSLWIRVSDSVFKQTKHRITSNQDVKSSISLISSKDTNNDISINPLGLLGKSLLDIAYKDCGIRK